MSNQIESQQAIQVNQNNNDTEINNTEVTNGTVVTNEV